MLISFTFRIARECAACRISLPINGLVEQVRCYHCGEVNQLGTAWWQYVVEQNHLAGALNGAEGETHETRVLSRNGNYVYAYGKRTPRCQACQGPDLALDRLPAEAADDGQCFCPACGQTIRLRPADDLARAVCDRAVLLVGETAADTGLQARTKIHLFACMGCGGGLKVDGSTRSVECEYCKAANYLPDGLWNQINPVPKPQAWFLVCDFDYPSMMALRWTDTETRIHDARSTQLSADQLATLSRDGAHRVRRSVAGNPACPPEHLERLAGDPDDDVRVGVAGNPSTPVAALLELARSQDERVWRALYSNDRQDAQVIELLAVHERAQARRFAAAHASLSLATLHRLAKDDNEGVQQEARARLDALRAQGVDVDAGRGFFAKLFS